MTQEYELPNNTLTLSLSGDIPLFVFADGMRHLSQLVNELSSTLVPNATIDWVIAHLEAGSATATIAGVSESQDSVEQVIAAFSAIGHALARGAPIPYPEAIQQQAIAITRLIDGWVESVCFETAGGEHTITHRYSEGIVSSPITYALGVIKGTIETISQRHGFKFTLYDALFDKAVTCMLAPSQKDIMRDAWGKKARVFGRIGRDPQTGYPVRVQSIVRIEVIPDVEPGSYRDARGLFRGGRSNTLPEDAIRRNRDV